MCLMVCFLSRAIEPEEREPLCRRRLSVKNGARVLRDEKGGKWGIDTPSPHPPSLPAPPNQSMYGTNEAEC
jgi:hypothetical protein